MMDYKDYEVLIIDDELDNLEALLLDLKHEFHLASVSSAQGARKLVNPGSLSMNGISQWFLQIKKCRM